MPQWKQLERDAGNWLKSFETDRVSFRNSFQAIIGFPSDGFRSDGLLTDGDVLLAVEIEAGQTHPDTNVGKYWFLHDNFQAYTKIILFHAYTPAFNSYGWRLRLGKFYANKIKAEVPFEYILLDYRSRADEDYESVLNDLKANIADVIRREFKIAEIEERDEDQLDDEFERDPRFLARIAQARRSLEKGEGVRLADIEFDEDSLTTPN